MDLKQFLPGQDEKFSGEHFWALIIEPGWVQAGIWRIEEDVANVVSAGQPTAWELDEDLVSAADTALTVSLQKFSEDLKEPSKTVFGLISAWVSGGQIKPEYLEKIKKICTELSLTPVGFVVLPEAIAHFLRSEEGSPLNAVILGVYKEAIEISVFRLGNLIGTSQVARSVSVVDDVSEGLSRFGGTEAIPSRFILYNGKEGELEEIKQALLKVNWDDFENLKFLHTPKVELVSPEAKASAVSLAGAAELADVVSVALAKPGLKEEVGKQEKKPLAEDIFGEQHESLEEDVAPKEGEPAREDDGEEEISAQELGFELEKDVAKEQKPLSASASLGQEPTEEDYAVGNVVPVEEEKVGGLANFPGFIKSLFSKMRGFAANLLKTGFAATGKRTIGIGLVFLLLLLVGGFASWIYFPRADITIYVSPQKLEEKADITIDTEAGRVDLTQHSLPGKELQTSISGEKTKSTTGTKTVGDRAKGEVTLYRVGPKITLSSETTLYGPDGMKFSLDESVEVASGSASTPGTTTTAVTADDIGAQYNLASGASFSVANYSVSDVEAKNDSAFTGGSSREISAVSAEDQDSLEKSLEEELKGKAISEFKDKLSSDEVFVVDSLVATASSRTFSNKVGDEASSLKLSLTQGATALAVNKSELLQLSSDVLKDKVPKGFVLRGDQINVDFSSNQKEDGTYKFSASIEANLLPDISTEDIAKKISGKYPSLAEDFLTKEVPGFVRAEIKLRPRLPGRLGSLPRIAKHIEVAISSE